MGEDECVDYNGRRAAEGWREQIEEAQRQQAYVIDGRAYPRVRYGDEARDWGADSGACHDCDVVRGQYDVPGCDVERCPACGGQVISCDCGYEGEDEGS